MWFRGPVEPAVKRLKDVCVVGEYDYVVCVHVCVYVVCA